MRYVETVENYVELETKALFTTPFTIIPLWRPSEVFIFENTLIFMGYSYIAYHLRILSIPFQFYKGEEDLLKLFQKFQVIPIFNVFMDDSDLVIEHKSPALWGMRAKLRLKDVVESDQFPEIKKLLHF